MSKVFKPTGMVSTVVSNVSKADFFCKTANQGFWYYDAMEGEKISGPTIYRYLVESAKNEVGVWDTYLNASDAVLFNTLSANINLRILTTINQKGEPDQGYDNYYRFLEEMKKIKKNNGFSFSMMGICKSTHQMLSTARIPHDRFLFIDDRVFVVGSSLHYHSIEADINRIGNIANTSITELTIDDNKKILKKDFESYWDKTSPKYKYVDILFDAPGISIK